MLSNDAACQREGLSVQWTYRGIVARICSGVPTMETVQVQFLGSGDAFGSGGRLQTCICIRVSTSTFLVDCGASSLIALRRFGVAPNDMDMILLTHLHGDHFGGIPFFVLDAQLISKRRRPLVIVGPPGTRRRVVAAMDLFFPGSSQVQQQFSLEIREFAFDQPHSLGDVIVTPYRVQHPAGDPSLALRMECNGKTITYTGDTAWTENLIPAAQGADLLIAEAYFFEKNVKFHLDFQTLLAHLDELQPKRLIVTHMSEDMLARLDKIACEWAEDGSSSKCTRAIVILSFSRR
jgi:ribonuclease BN (tRNA processing enzyme)